LLFQQFDHKQSQSYSQTSEIDKPSSKRRYGKPVRSITIEMAFIRTTQEHQHRTIQERSIDRFVRHLVLDR